MRERERERESCETYLSTGEQVSNAKQNESLVKSGVAEEFERMLFVAHYSAVRCAALPHRAAPPTGPQSLLDVAAKASASRLRFTDIIPVDKAFYEAGTIAKVPFHISDFGIAHAEMRIMK